VARGSSVSSEGLLSERTDGQRRGLLSERTDGQRRGLLSERTDGQRRGLLSERTGGQRRGLLSERPLHGGPSRSHRGRAKETPALPVVQTAIPPGPSEGPRRCSRPKLEKDLHTAQAFPRSRQKKPGHPRGAGSARAVGRTGQRAGRPGPDGGNQLHPVVSPQFSHLWQVPLRTVSHPQRGQGGASGVELSRR